MRCGLRCNWISRFDPATRRAIEAGARELEVIAKERIRDELDENFNDAAGRRRGSSCLKSLACLTICFAGVARRSWRRPEQASYLYRFRTQRPRARLCDAARIIRLKFGWLSLLHDVGKPRSKKGDGPDSTFYQHEYIGAKMAVKALDRLRFSREFVEKVAHLVRRHMFFYDVGDGYARRRPPLHFSCRSGKYRRLDQSPRSRSHRLRRRESGFVSLAPFLFMIDKVKHDPLTPKMLKINGDDLMAQLGLPQSLRVGWILHSLLEEVLDDPEKNTKNI